MADALTLEEIEALEPNYLGPSWKRNEDGTWALPEYTLGWQILGWCAEFLNNFDGTPNLRLTPEQARIVLWWYAVDEDGQFINNRGAIQRLKGAGKDPLISVISMVEFLGPSRFSHWETSALGVRTPVGVAHPNAWVQIAAVSRDQTRNTMTLFPSIISRRAIEAYGIKLGAELIRAEFGRKRIEAVTSSYRALEGGRSTFVVLNETQHWVKGTGGDKMHETIDGNATKMGSRYLAITNAYLPGEDSVAEKMRESYERMREGRAHDFGFMYDSIEAHPKTPLTPEALRIVIPKIRGDATWLSVDAIIKSVLDTTISPARSRRMFLNQIVADEDAIYGPAEWDPLEDPNATLAPGDEIVLGFDGGKSDDATALIALRVKDSCAFKLGVWERPADVEHWEVPRDQVDSVVHDAHRVYKVRAFYADVSLWESYISEWSSAYGEGYAVKAPGKDAIGWDMRGSLKTVTRAHERLMQAVFDKKVRHDGDLTLRRHALNARRRVNNYGISFGKESKDSPRKIDAYAALMLAHEALYDLRARGKKARQRTGQGYFL